MICPECQREMERGTLCTEGGIGLYFVPADVSYQSLFTTKRTIEKCGGVVLDGPYQVRFRKTRLEAWVCRRCRKSVVSF